MLIDAHAHLDMYREEDLTAVLGEIGKYRILTLSGSMDPESYERNVRISKQSDFVVPVFGVHPWNAPKFADRLEDLVRPAVEAPIIGEVGFDRRFVEDPSQFPQQETVLDFFFRAARDQNKIVILHTPGAEQEILEWINTYDIERGIVHWYAGPLDVLHGLIEKGMYFTVGVELSGSRRIQEIAAAIPLERLLTETDNPGGLKWLSGDAGRPVILQEVIEVLAGLRNMAVADMEAQIEANFRHLIFEDPWLSDVTSRFFAAF